MRRLKCPQCRQHSAWLNWGYSEKAMRQYKQKFCSCGYEGKRHYFGTTKTPDEYRQHMDEMHQRITERLKEKGLA